MISKAAFVLCFAILFLSGCREAAIPKVAYSGFVDMPAEGIPTNWVYEFNATESDSLDVISGTHNVVIIVRYTYDCPSKDLVLYLEETSLAQEKPDSATLKLNLFNGEGRRVGKGGYGIFEIADTIRRNERINDGYTVSVSSPLPENQTSGIKAIGIVVD